MSRARTLADYVSSGVTAAEFDYMDGVTSNVQTQIDAAGPSGITDNSNANAMTIGSDESVTFANEIVLTPGSAPATTEGAIYYDSTSNLVKIYNGSAWEDLTNTYQPKAGGGEITFYSSGGVNYMVHSFRTSGTFASNFAGTVDYLVVAGGGGGGGISGGQASGAGGAGGFRTASGFAVTIGSSPYTITVGGGGAGGGTDISGTIGGNSIFGSITSTGGGYGGKNNAEGGDGGSGGGGGYIEAKAGGDGIYDSGQTLGHLLHQGRDGGAGHGITVGGGGGGASEVGGDGDTSPWPMDGAGGDGGLGEDEIMGLSAADSYTLLTNASAGHDSGGARYFSGGGGGGAYLLSRTAGTGGTGGGGAGSRNSGTPTAGTANTGGGGGGVGGNGSTAVNGADGGSGIVIIRYTI